MDRPIPSSLIRDISPPRLSKRRKLSRAPTPSAKDSNNNASTKTEPTLAAVEAGKEKVEDHLAYFKQHLSYFSRDTGDDCARLSIERFVDLYEANQHEHGNHFVIHQHNHPRAGVHYDLRLQFSKSSSMSFAVPKGLPGNPNSKSKGRMAIETRVHNLWNHLIESASHKTGSLLIWDTGTYTILPRKMPHHPKATQQTTDEEKRKLIHAFQTRYIRLRLHGTRLPKNYTITLRLPSANDFGKATTHRKRRQHTRTRRQRSDSIDSEPDDISSPRTQNQPQPQPSPEQDNAQDIDTDTSEDATTRLHNAYPGSTNSIGSVHQRQWFLLLDQRSSGFVLRKPGGLWECDGDGGFEPFIVRGREYERSVVTGRLAAEVEGDEGVEGYVGRAGWVGIEH